MESEFTGEKYLLAIRRIGAKKSLIAFQYMAATFEIDLDLGRFINLYIKSFKILEFVFIFFV